VVSRKRSGLSGHRDLVMQAGDSRAETDKPNRHIPRQSVRVRSLEQLLRQGVQIAAQMARQTGSFDEKCCSA